MTDSPHAVQLRDLHRAYGSVRAVDGIDLTIAPGEVVALLGPNGAGKSTTIDMLLGLTRPDRGEVSVFGLPPHAAVARGLVGAMLQSGGFPDDITAAEVVGLMAALFPAPLPVAQTLDRAGVTHVARQRFGRLSGGEKQRVRFAAALVCDPDLLVLDEPTVAMDVQARRDFWAAMRGYTATGRAVVFATHYLAEAEEFADRVVLLAAGRVVADGSVAEVRSRVGGRVLSVTVPGGDRRDLELLPGVAEVRVDGPRVHLACTDSDATLRALLTAFPAARDVEVVSHGLEDAFIALTSSAKEN